MTNFIDEPSPRDRYRGALLGLAVGDAVGTTLEFRPRDVDPPLTDLVGGGPFNLKPGEWTDDTAMALCLAESIVSKGGFDPLDQMNRYTAWWRRGRWSCTGRCFDIGNTVSAALGRFADTGDPFAGSTDPQSAGNGSLMRLAPLAMAFAEDDVADYCADGSRTTHAAVEAIDACRAFGRMLAAVFAGEGNRRSIFEVGAATDSLSPKVAAVLEYRQRTRDSVRGTGYVVDCLEAAMWAFDSTDSYRDCVLAAANLADDADTTAAVAGQIAGAFYGVGGIPSKWLDKLAFRGQITRLADALFNFAHGEATPFETRAATAATLLLRHKPADDDEGRSRHRMLELADAAARPFDRSHFSPGHFTASAFVLSPDKRSLLLIHHAKLDRWLQPGGHIDPTDAHPLAAALREVAEETGLALKASKAPLFDVDVHPIPANPKKREPAHEHFDLRYLLHADTLAIAAGSDALDARWVPLDEAARVEDASVRRAVSKLRQTP